MQINISPNSYFVFDLDDTLIFEVDFLKSAFKSISEKLHADLRVSVYDEMLDKFYAGENAFESLVKRYSSKLPYLSVGWLLNEYHHHFPELSAKEDALRFLCRLKDFGIPMGLLTDGQSLRQRNKIAAAGIEMFFSDIIISEEFGSAKPDERNYLHFVSKNPYANFFAVADNTSKDFIVPQALGWTTICVRDCGKHIHSQSFSRKTLPDYIIGSFDDVEICIPDLITA